MKSKTLFMLAMLCLTLTGVALAQQADDREAVRQAVLDYVEGISKFSRSASSAVFRATWPKWVTGVRKTADRIRKAA